MKYLYSAVFSPSEDEGKVYARVPDLPGCITTGSSLQDAILQITDAASGWLVVAEDNSMPIPPATPQADIERTSSDILSVICVDTLAYRARTDTRSVRKNVSLPAWLARLADARGVNCSQVLQEALISRFDV